MRLRRVRLAKLVGLRSGATAILPIAASMAEACPHKVAIQNTEVINEIAFDPRDSIPRYSVLFWYSRQSCEKPTILTKMTSPDVPPNSREQFRFFIHTSFNSNNKDTFEASVLTHPQLLDNPFANYRRTIVNSSDRDARIKLGEYIADVVDQLTKKTR